MHGCLARVGRVALALCVLILLLGCPPPLPPRVVIDSPMGGTVGLTVTFRWHLDSAGSRTPTSPGETYQYEVRLDKGVNACDSQIEQSFEAGTATCLAVELPAAIYDGQRVDFGVRATNSIPAGSAVGNCPGYGRDWRATYVLDGHKRAGHGSL